MPIRATCGCIYNHGKEFQITKTATGCNLLRPNRNASAEGERIIVKCEFLFE